MAASQNGSRCDERRKQVMLGNLPNDFLRVSGPEPTAQEAADHAAAMHLQQQLISQSQQTIGCLQVTVVSAVLKKNYGMTRMDPYVRVRFGEYDYETQTDVNGAKTPRWNKTFNIYQMPKGVKSIHVQVFDERTLTDDELIAWTTITIPDVVYQGETVDEWYSLSGKLGDGQEGTINVITAYTNTASIPRPVMVVQPGTFIYPGTTYPGTTPVPVYTMPHPQQQQQPTIPQPQPIKEEDLKQVCEMFPSVESEVVKSVLEASNGNKEVAINSLLQMQDS